MMFKKKIIFPGILVFSVFVGSATYASLDTGVSPDESLKATTQVAKVKENGSETITFHTTSAVDLSDRKKLVGWADNVFVGKIQSKIGTKKILENLPETQFSVDVIKNIKGNLDEEVVVNQQGGYDKETNKTYTLHNDKFLQEGKVYLFVTKYNKEYGFHTVVPVKGHLVANDKQQRQNLINQFVQAKKNQIDFEIDPGKGPDTGEK